MATPTGIEAANETAQNADEKAESRSAPVSRASESARVGAASSESASAHASESLTIDELEAAIARLTRRIATADDKTIDEIVAERKALRLELEARQREHLPSNVRPMKPREVG